MSRVVIYNKNRESYVKTFIQHGIFEPMEAMEAIFDTKEVNAQSFNSLDEAKKYVHSLKTSKIKPGKFESYAREKWQYIIDD